MLKNIIEAYFKNPHRIGLYSVIFIVPAAILLIGDFDRQLMIQDSSTSGPYSSNLLLYSEVYSDDIMRYISNLGYLSPGVIIQNFLFLTLGISPILTSYILVLIGGLFFCYSIFSLSKSYAIDDHNAMLISYMAIAFVILDINLAKFGPGTVLQAFPDMNFFAYGMICLIFASVLKNNFLKANLLTFSLIFVHLGHALLTLPVLGIIYFYKALKKDSKFRTYFLSILFLIFSVGIIFLISYFIKNTGESFSNEYLWKIIISELGGHTYPWENYEFISILSQFFIAFAMLHISLSSIISNKKINIDKKIFSRFLIILSALILVISLYIILDIFLFNFPILDLIPFIQLHPLRATNYIQLFIFPVFAFYLLNNIISNSSLLNLKIFSILFLIFGIAFKSISLWIFLPFLIYFDKNIIKKNHLYFYLLIYLASYFFISFFISKIFLDITSTTYFVLNQSTLSIFDFGKYLNLPNFILFKLIAAFVILGTAALTKKYLVGKIKLKPFMINHIFISLILLSSIYLESINWFAGSIWFNKNEKPTLEVLHWMNKSSQPSEKFMTINRQIQMNGISNRPTFRPYPFFAEMYRANSIEVQNFSEEILNFWNIDLGDTHGWFEEHKSEINMKYNNMSEEQVVFLKDKFNFDYMITSSNAKKLNFKEVYINQDYVIYKIE